MSDAPAKVPMSPGRLFGYVLVGFPAVALLNYLVEVLVNAFGNAFGLYNLNMSASKALIALVLGILAFFILRTPKGGGGGGGH